jgi:hypothetical protein
MYDMKVCLMRKVRLRYERDSTLKKVVLAKSDTWAQVRAKIARVFERLHMGLCIEEDDQSISGDFNEQIPHSKRQ